MIQRPRHHTGQCSRHLYIHWDNPFVGSNSYDQPVGGFIIRRDGGGGDNASVTFTLEYSIDSLYNQLGGPNGFLGAPVTDELPTPDGVGHFRHYQGGSIYSSPQTGPHEVHGRIRDKWSSLGWGRSRGRTRITGKSYHKAICYIFYHRSPKEHMFRLGIAC